MGKYNLKKDKMEKIIDIDDVFHATSKLKLSVIPELKSVEFYPEFQFGSCSPFSLHVADIDETVEFLMKAKEELKSE